MRASRQMSVTIFRRCAALLGPPLAVHAASSPYPAHCGVQEAPCAKHMSSTAETCGKFRLVQFNVRRLTAEDGTSTVEAVAQSLHALRPHVVCLNEVDVRSRPDGLKQLATAIGADHVAFFGHVRGTYGNAIISQLPILNTKDVHLDGGTEVEWPRDSGKLHRIQRGLLAATLRLPHAVSKKGTKSDEDHALCAEQITIFCTHLDHIKEEQRVIQMSHVLREMRELGGTPHMLVGDLNALCLEDYNETEWASIVDKAARNGWNHPQDAECVRMLMREGYADAFRVAHACHEGDIVMAQSTKHKFTAHAGHPMYRIDYALLNTEAHANGIAVSNAFVDERSSGSDHLPLVVDLSINFCTSPAGVGQKSLCRL